MKPRLRFARVLLLALTALASTIASAAPAANLWERWLDHDPASTVTIDHGAWSSLLGRYVATGADGINRVDYGRVTRADRALLTGYLADLGSVRISDYSRPEQLAYWINLYNALTIQVVLEHFPVASIRDIDLGGALFAKGPWRRKLMTVEGERLSLDDIEHRILRPIWRDPRIHYAVNCAALGCPNLQAHAFSAGTSEAMLAAAARDYVNHPRGAEFIDGRLVVSSIYSWFEKDFGGNDAAVIAHLGRYADPPLASRLKNTARIADDRYDWSLNDLTSAP